MAVEPQDRFATPQAVMRALLPFLKGDSFERTRMQTAMLVTERNLEQPVAPGDDSAPRVHRVLIVDDEPSIREFCKAELYSDGIACGEAACGLSALEELEAHTYDLVLLDINMPNLNGAEVLKRLRQSPRTPHLKIIMFSGMASSNEMAEMLLAGADD